MVYILLSRFGRMSHCAQHLRYRLNSISFAQISALQLHSLDLIRFNAWAWSFGQPHGVLGQSRALHVGARCRNRGVKEKDQVTVSSSQPSSGLSAAQKVKRAGTDFTYMIVVLVGLGVTGGLLYVIFQELVSSSSPSKLYGKALNKCRSHPEVIGAFGEPIKGYGETTRRGRRQQVSHAEYMKDGLKHMRLKFYIEGSEPGLHGTVHSESRENPETGKYEFRYIFVDVDRYPRRTIVVEDNR